MKKLISMIGLAAATLAVGFQAMAVPAKPGLRAVTMPDGTEVRVRVAGDEFFHQYFTEDGYPLLCKDGYFYYSDITPEGGVVDSGIKATLPGVRTAEAKAFVSRIDMNGLEDRIRVRASKAPRAVKFAELMKARANSSKAAPAKGGSLSDAPIYERGYGLFPGVAFPAYGHQKSLVFLVEYQDVKFHDTYDVDAKDYFTRLLNEEGFSDVQATGSAADWFRQNSDGTFLPQFDVYGPVTLSNKQAYYGGNDYNGNDLRAHLMVKEACDQLDDVIDFSQYDADKDGLIDNVFVFYAGTGEADSGKANDVWPHSWTMSAAGLKKSEVMYDGKRLESYTCSNEWQTRVDDRGYPVADDPGIPDGIGTFVHEFSHAMGLPDLYATSYTSSFTPGNWSVLDYGPYNNDSRTPPNYSAFERYALGWIKPRVVKDAVAATLPPITENVCAIIPTSKDTEFFLIENRQQEGWDTYVPGHGMLVWHIDYNSSVWNRNSVNNTSYHQYVDLMEADNKKTEATRAGDAFPGTANVTEFTAETTPGLKTWTSQYIDLPITDITENDGMIYFNVLGGSNDVIAPASDVEASDVTGDSFVVKWMPVEGLEAVVSVFELTLEVTGDDNGTEAGDKAVSGRASGNSGDVVYVAGFHNRNAGAASEIEVSGLKPNTRYGYTVMLIDGLKETEAVHGEPVTTNDMSGVITIGDASPTKSAVTIEGRTLSVDGDARVVVTDLTGSVVAAGEGSATVAAPGLYVVYVPGTGAAFKVMVR